MTSPNFETFDLESKMSAPSQPPVPPPTGADFDEMDLMDVACGAAPPALAARIEAYATAHPESEVAALLVAYRAFAGNEPVDEAPLPGSFLTRMTRDQFERDEVLRGDDPEPRAAPVAEPARRNLSVSLKPAEARDGEFVSDHTLLWPIEARTGAEPPVLDRPDELPELPAHRIDTNEETVTLIYPADRVPLGHARVVALDAAGTQLGSCRAEFRTDSSGCVAVLKAGLLGLTIKAPPQFVRIRVTPG